MTEVIGRKTCYVLLSALLLLLVGCLPPARQAERLQPDYRRDPMQVARINCFLQLARPDGPAVRMELARLEILADDTWLPLRGESGQIDSARLGSGQQFVGAQNLPPGTYRRLRVTLNRVEVQAVDGSVSVPLAEAQRFEISFNRPLTLGVDDSKTLQLVWDVDASLKHADDFAPRIRGMELQHQVWSNLLFVSCPNIDTIFVIRADNNRVISSFGLKGAPTYLALDPNSSNHRMYVLCNRERMIKVVDLETYQVTDFFAASLNENPTDMLLSPNGEALYLLDERSGYLTRMDPVTGQIEARIFLDYRPRTIQYLPSLRQLAVSQALAQKILLLDPDNLQIAAVYPVGSAPEGLLELDGSLYVAERGDGQVRVINLSTGRTSNRFAVGLGPQQLLAAGRQIYVGNARSDSLSVLEPGGFGEVQRIRKLGQPGEMIGNDFYRRLYVTEQSENAVAVIDVNTNRLLSHIELGAMPVGLEVVE